MSNNSVTVGELQQLINQFKVSDLQDLLSSVGKQRNGRKTELLARINELLTNPPRRFNLVAFTNKVKSIHQNMLLENRAAVANNANAKPGSSPCFVSLPSSIPVQQVPQRAQVPQRPQVQQRVQMQQRPQVPQQPQQIQQLLQQMQQQQSQEQQVQQQIQQQAHQMQQYQQQQRQQIQQHAPQRINFRVAPQAYQLNNVYGNVIVPNVQMVNPVPAQSPSRYQYQVAATPQPVPFNVLESTVATFEDLPFYRNVHVVISPTFLINTGANSLPPNHPKMAITEECSVSFMLSLEATNVICENRNITQTSRDYKFQGLLRFGVVQSNKPMLADLMPLNLLVRINNKQCTLPPNCPITKVGMDVRKQPRPVDVSDLLKLCPMVDNVLTVNFSPEKDKQFCFGLCVMEKLTPKYLLDELLKIALVESDVTRQLVVDRIKSYEGNEDIVGNDGLLVSLNCPLGTRRIVYPMKGKSCEHFAFFDGLNYISLNEKKPSWLCPICKQPAAYQDLQCFSFMMDILNSGDLPKDCQFIQLLSDGSWKVGDDLESNQIILDKSEDEEEEDRVNAAPRNNNARDVPNVIISDRESSSDDDDDDGEQTNRQQRVPNENNVNDKDTASNDKCVTLVAVHNRSIVNSKRMPDNESNDEPTPPIDESDSVDACARADHHRQRIPVKETVTEEKSNNRDDRKPDSDASDDDDDDDGDEDDEDECSADNLSIPDDDELDTSNNNSLSTGSDDFGGAESARLNNPANAGDSVVNLRGGDQQSTVSNTSPTSSHSASSEEEPMEVEKQPNAESSADKLPASPTAVNGSRNGPSVLATADNSTLLQ